MKNGNILIALVIGGVIGFVIGKATTSTTSGDVAANDVGSAGDKAKAAPAAGTAGDPADSIYKVPLRDAYVKGPATAKVTIVEWSDFECPFCQRGFQTVQKIEETYGQDVRVAFKQNPLPMHPHAPGAAEASLAAGEQGKFWEMHDKMFQNREHLERADLEKYAADIGLDVTKFKADLDSGKFKAQVQRDQQEAQKFAAAGTPHFFINGHRLVGAQPFEKFKELIDGEIKKADAAIAAGTARDHVYEYLTKNGLEKGTSPAPAKNDNKPNQPEAPKVMAITDIAGSPERGPKDAKVTIVEWSDFQCPFCGRVVPTVDKILKDYPKDVRLIWKNEPLPFHPNAAPAALAALAAQNQGKFWEFYDLAFAHQTELSPEKYDEWANQIHLNMAKFKADIADPKTKARLDADSAYGQKVGANGTPHFFVNGRVISGAQPYESFKATIDEEIKKADEELKKGTPASKLYEKLTDINVKNAPKPPPPQPGDDGKPVHIEAGNSPVRGAAKAPVTIIEFSDFQCPFCGRVEPTISEILKKYDGKIKIVWKNQPLPFHPNARPAAKAALAAGEQGKFWEMHDKMFGAQTELSPEKYESWAKELGLNVDKFKADEASTKYDALIDADSQLGGSVGANGTPTFFINGHKLVGAQPTDAFSKAIDDALAAK